MGSVLWTQLCSVANLSRLCTDHTEIHVVLLLHMAKPTLNQSFEISPLFSIHATKKQIVLFLPKTLHLFYLIINLIFYFVLLFKHQHIPMLCYNLIYRDQVQPSQEVINNILM